MFHLLIPQYCVPFVPSILSQKDRVSNTIFIYCVGWRVSRTTHTEPGLDALEQALHDRRSVYRGSPIHHGDGGSQYISKKCTERLVEVGTKPFFGSAEDSYENALAETINRLYKAEVIYWCGPWRNFEAVEFATSEDISG